MFAILAPLLLGAGLPSAVLAAPAPYYAEAPSARPEIIAHAAGKGLRPENTLIALRAAEEMGADVLEVDVQMTKEGTLILLHDATLDRTTDMSGAVANLTYDEIALADAGFRFVDGAGDNYGGRGIGVPTLEAALKRFPASRFILEIKPDGAAAAELVCARIKKEEAEQRVLVASFHDKAMKAFRRACPKVATSLTASEARTFFSLSRIRLSFFMQTGGIVLQLPPRDENGRTVIDERLLRAAHGAGLRVEAWTVNDPAEMKRLLALGVDGIMTDRVDLLVDLLTLEEEKISRAPLRRDLVEKQGAPWEDDPLMNPPAVP